MTFKEKSLRDTYTSIVRNFTKSQCFGFSTEKKGKNTLSAMKAFILIPISTLVLDYTHITNMSYLQPLPKGKAVLEPSCHTPLSKYYFLPQQMAC